jgi:hypothetical protein
LTDFLALVFEGSGYEPNLDFYIKFEERHGEYACEDDDEAPAEAAAAYAEEDDSLKATS